MKFLVTSSIGLGLLAATSLAPLPAPVAVAPVANACVGCECWGCGGSHEPGLVPWRGRTSLGPYGIQPQEQRPTGYRVGPQMRPYGYRPGPMQQPYATQYNTEREVQVQSYSYERRTCHDWVMRNGVKRYLGPPHAC